MGRCQGTLVVCVHYVCMCAHKCVCNMCVCVHLVQYLEVYSPTWTCSSSNHRGAGLSIDSYTASNV